jgi:hypothetical protein
MKILFRPTWPDGLARDLRDFAVLAAILLAAYGAALLVPFAYHDDYYYFAYDERSSRMYHPQALFIQFTGRQLYNFIATPMAAVLWEVSDFTLIRAVVIGTLVLAAFMLARVLERLGVTRWHAMAVASCVFLLPGMQLGVIWVTLAPCAAALILSLIAAYAMIPAAPGARSKAAGWAVASFALLLTALFVYPPWAMFFVVLVFARVLFEREEGARRLFASLALQAGIFAAAAIAYFYLHKFVYLPAFAAKHPDHYARWVKAGSYEFALAADLMESARRFTETVVVTSAKLWSLYASWEVVAVVLALIIAGGLASLRAVARGEVTRAAWAARAVALAALSIACVLPVLAASASHSGYRVVLPFSAVLVLALYASVRTLARESLSARWRTPVLAGLVLSTGLFAAATAHMNVRASALNARLELSLLRAALLEPLSHGRALCHVHVALTRAEPSFLGLPARGDGEFNLNSSAYRLNAPWMVRAALAGVAADRRSLRVVPRHSRDLTRECVDGRSEITVTAGELEEPFYAFPQTVLINLNGHLPRNPVPPAAQQ